MVRDVQAELRAEADELRARLNAVTLAGEEEVRALRALHEVCPCRDLMIRWSGLNSSDDHSQHKGRDSSGAIESGKGSQKEGQTGFVRISWCEVCETILVRGADPESCVAFV